MPLKPGASLVFLLGAQIYSEMSPVEQQGILMKNETSCLECSQSEKGSVLFSPPFDALVTTVL